MLLTNALVSLSLVAVCFVAFYLERQAWAKRPPMAVTIIVVSMLLSNVGLMPHSSPVYGFIYQYLVPIAIPLLLFKAQLRGVIDNTRRVLPLFIVGALGTVMGGTLVLAFLPVPSDMAKLVSVFVATNIGGSINFLSMVKVSEIDAPDLVASALVADSIVGFSYLFLLTILPSLKLLTRFMPKSSSPNALSFDQSVRPEGDQARYFDVIVVVSLAVLIFFIGGAVAKVLSIGHMSVLITTVLALACANFAPLKLAKRQGDFEVGMFLMCLFFAAIGSGTDLGTVFNSAGDILLLNIAIVVTHLLVLLFVGFVLKADLADLIIASNACVLGPPTAAAYASHRHWHHLVTPAIMCGVLGYVIANFIGTIILYLLPFIA